MSCPLHVVYILSILHKFSFLLSAQHPFCFLSLVFLFSSNIVCEGTYVSLFSAFLTVIILLISIPSLILDHLLLISPSFHLSVSGRNNSKSESLSSPAQRRLLPLSPRPPFNFPIPRQKHAMQLFSFIVQQVVDASFPQDCFKSQSTDIVLFSLISASHLSLGIRPPEIDNVRGPYF